LLFRIHENLLAIFRFYDNELLMMLAAPSGNLALNQVAKTFGAMKAVDRIDLDIAAGLFCLLRNCIQPDAGQGFGLPILEIARRSKMEGPNLRQPPLRHRSL
jgi:hypothetical protein